MIKQYINKLNINDIISFGIKNNIFLTNNEANIIYNYIKNYWQIIIYGNPINVFNKLKNEINEENYNKIISLYHKYKKKYNLF